MSNASYEVNLGIREAAKRAAERKTPARERHLNDAKHRQDDGVFTRGRNTHPQADEGKGIPDSKSKYVAQQRVAQREFNAEF
ncbi:MAG: hypothetical protein ACPG05_03930 [Bdellovibrionales bacterium]